MAEVFRNFLAGRQLRNDETAYKNQLAQQQIANDQDARLMQMRETQFADSQADRTRDLQLNEEERRRQALGRVSNMAQQVLRLPAQNRKGSLQRAIPALASDFQLLGEDASDLSELLAQTDDDLASDLSELAAFGAGADAKPQNPMVVSAGGVVYDPVTRKPLFTNSNFAPRGDVRFRTLSPQEVQAAGFPAGTVVQQNGQTGEFNVVSKPPDTRGGGGGGLPVGALRMVDDAKQAMAATKESLSLIDGALNTIRSGKVDLGVASNAVARSRNALGLSSEGSRAYSSIRQTLEKLRNNYLLLAKGVQTEGDATRAWNSEIGESVQNDNKLAIQQLEKARGLIQRMTELQQDRIDTVYANYGAEPPNSGGAAPTVDVEDLLNKYAPR